MVSVKYSLTKEDYVNFYTYVMWDAGDVRKKRAKTIFKQAGFVLLFIAVFYFAGGFRYMSKITLFILLLMFATSFLPLLTGRTSADREAEEIVNDPDNNVVFAETLLQATENGLQIKTQYAETNYSWKAIVRKTETEAYWFLFVNGIQAIIIPKRIFGSKIEKAEFEKILLRNLSLEAEVNDVMRNGGE